ncbi:hypothetical protein MUK42_02178 [Musa troglodytarum]|uniref:RPM1 interacting protein 13 n=1 Tax=Musa troglodytarum TaxID=320322 RepID=A0A9E7JGG6_9LILI|nr:hypothetical protein MUK42_02178 [Musa troglodytarum]URD79996.1 hypothetical protein MUK42_02178 [Musa troglodytarum]
MGADHVVVVDISSDEEDLGLDASDGLSFNSFEVLDRSDGRRQEESDDVVIVDEFSASSAAKRPKKDSGLLAPDKGSGFDDDDCVVLDSDPDKPVSVVDDKGGEIGDRGDDLLIVAEKGQFACRDYPHPRHLCAHLPFSSSPHEKLCDLCHCYVCDSPAPCTRWGIGDKSADHCHSTDKEERWKYQRQAMFQTKTSQRPRSPQVGQQRSEDPLATSPGASADQMLANISSHFTLPTKQSSMCPPVTAADDSQESWQNVLASVASELGVSMFSDPATSNAQRPPMFPSSSPPFDESYSKTDASQDTWSVPANSNPGSLDYDCRWSHDTMAQIQEHSPVEDPHL